MNLLHWKPEYSVGVASIDDEHREMIEAINEIYAQLDTNADAVQIDECLGDIFSAISMHFALEERMMKTSAYDEYEAHKNDHEALLDQIRDLMDDVIRDPKAGLVKLEQKLSDWFAGHFSTFDARLHNRLGF